MVTPYLPDIMSDVVARVAVEVGFPVYYSKGIHPQVSRELGKQTNWPLIWFYMPEEVRFGNWRVWGEANVEIYICTNATNTSTQQQREDTNFKPVLLPVYDSLMRQIKAEGWFQFPIGPVKHTRNLLPFWGLGQATDKENMLNKFVDCIRIKIPVLPIRKSSRSCTPHLVTNT
jgi:hypothetical protein